MEYIVQPTVDLPGMNKKTENKKDEIRINNNQTVAYLSV